MRKDEDEIVQVLNPKVNRYMKINKTIGAIIGVKKSLGPYKNIRIVEKSKERLIMKKTKDELAATPKKNIFCECCGEKVSKENLKNKPNFSFDSEIVCEACLNDLTLALGNMINSIRKSNGNLFLTRIKK